MSIERHIYVCHAPQIELRGNGDGPKSLVGYAAVFNSRTSIGPYDEMVASNAFDEFMSMPDMDVVALFDHAGQPLGRTSNGTLQLSVDAHGLRYSVTPPDTQLGRDIMQLVKRGDVSASSFAFSLRGDGDSWNYDGPTPLRTLRNLNIHDVSPVTSPAYASTTVSARAKIPIILPTKEGIQPSVDEYERVIEQLRARNCDVRKMRFGS